MIRSSLVLAALAPLLLAASPARLRSPLAPPPDWTAFPAGAVTASELRDALNAVYAPGDAWRETIRIDEAAATVSALPASATPARIPLAVDPASRQPAPRFWRAASELPANPSRPLDGAHIAIDPGHIGGSWARIEERWFQIEKSKPVMEGEMTLRTAKLLASRLRSLGAKVTLVRKSNRPVGRLDVKALAPLARQVLAERGVVNPAETYTDRADPERGNTIQAQSEILAYRTQEIRARAERINTRIQPDLVLCLHFNAEAWGDPRSPELVDKNHLHLLVHGACSADELRLDDVRHDTLLRIAQGIHPEELALSKSIAASMETATGLPPYQYTSNNAIPMPGSEYVWARNLIASRLYMCPVVFAEPYVMNHPEVFERVQAGDYRGERLVAGRMRKSIFREYADSVVDGITAHYQRARSR